MAESAWSTEPSRAAVPPGTGWPGDLASPATPVARDGEQVERLAGGAANLRELDARVSVCRACARLVEWRESVAATKRAAFRGQPYWGRPVSGFGDEHPTIAILGLAPAAHGGNRTGRVFTGDPSGDWLFSALFRVGLANRSTSTSADDCLELRRTRVLAAVRCAPPDNKPTTGERDRCAHWLHAELRLIGPSLRVIVALGAFAWRSVFPALTATGAPKGPFRVPRFGHGARVDRGPVTVLASYHPSQRNTSTGKLSRRMLDDVLSEAARIGAADPDGAEE